VIADAHQISNLTLLRERIRRINAERAECAEPGISTSWVLRILRFRRQSSVVNRRSLLRQRVRTINAERAECAEAPSSVAAAAVNDSGHNAGSNPQASQSERYIQKWSIRKSHYTRPSPTLIDIAIVTGGW